jgi:hypothetical protein
MMPIDAVRTHPRHREIFGVASAQSKEAIRASIVAKGVLLPFVVTAPDAEENGSCLLDGNKRREIMRELGFTEIPVVIEPSLQTEVAQVEWMFGVAQRADHSPRERAQQAEAFRAYLDALPKAERRQRYGAKEPAAIVAMVICQDKRNVHRLHVVFHSASSTEELKVAVDSGRLPLSVAYKIIQTAERRRAPGSENARRFVNSLLRRAVAVREGQVRGKWRRAPRTPVYDPTPKPPSFLQETQRQIAEWAISETPPSVRNRTAYATQVQAATKDLMVELRAATSAFRARLRRLGSRGLSNAAPSSHLPRLNDALAVLNLRPVRSVDDVDLDDVKRTHRLLARALHPDVNASPGAREAFEKMHGAYEHVLEICDR